MKSMKKILTALLTTALLASVNGCQTAPSDPAPALQTLTVKNEPDSESNQTTVDMSAALEQIIAGLNYKPTVSTIEKSVIKDEHDSQTTSPHTEGKSARAPIPSAEGTGTQGEEPTEPPKAADPTSTPKQLDTEPNATMMVTVKATPTPPPAATPTPAPTPKPLAPTPIPAAPAPEPVVEEPSFDIGYWIGYAQSYAQGLGLRLESSAVDCWDNPIGAGPHSICLERDIASRLNRYASDQDITDVWIWYESTGGNCYEIYIGYA